MTETLLQVLRRVIDDRESDLATWLSAVVDGRLPDGVMIPPSEQPLDALFSSLRQLRDPDRLRAVALAGSALITRWMERYAEDPSIPESAVRRLSGVLELFARVPAPREAAHVLNWFYLDPRSATLTFERRNLRQQALLALAISPPELPVTQLEELFSVSLSKPELANTGFTGLVRLSPAIAIRHISEMLDTLNGDDAQIHGALWSLFRAIEQTPEQAGRLRDELRDRPDHIQTIESIVGDALSGATQFPRAWLAFQETSSSARADQPGPRFRTLAALDEKSEQAIETAVRRSEPCLLAA